MSLIGDRQLVVGMAEIDADEIEEHAKALAGMRGLLSSEYAADMRVKSIVACARSLQRRVERLVDRMESL